MTNSLSENRIKGRGLLFTVAFLLPVVLFMVLCAVNHRYPFGDVSYMGRDMVHQYIKYFSYLRSIAQGENDVFYTFSKTLGGDMTGLWAYYLLSPLNIVFFFIPKLSLPLAINLITAAKLGLCGLFMAWLMSESERTELSVLIFSTAYAFMSYNMIYFSNIMWLDGVYILPLVVLGLERLVSGGSGRLYVLALAFALIANYYIGYMLCIFSVLYFVFKAVVLLFEDKKCLAGTVFRYALSSFLAGALAAVVLIPTAMALSGTKASFDLSKLAMYPMFSLAQHLSKLVCAAVPSGFIPGDQVMLDLPNIYCGAVTSAFLAMYFFNGKIRLSNRISSALLIAVLFLSYNFNGTYLVWHGFNYPALFPYRNAFLMSFLMLWYAWRCYAHRDGLSLKGLAGALIAVALVILLINPLGNALVSKKMMALDMAAIALAFVSVLYEIKRPAKKVFLPLLLVAQLSLLLINANSYADGTLKTSAFKENAREKENTLKWLEEYDSSFYRLGWLGDEPNESMLFAYDGFSHFSSTEKTQSKNFAINFGFNHFADVWVKYREGSTAAADAFLGIKYVLGDIGDNKNYPLVYQDGSDNIFLNPNSLGLAFFAHRDALDFDADARNIFEWQEQLFSAVLGREAGIFIPQSDVNEQVINMTEKPYKGDAVEYMRKSPDKEHAICYSFIVQEEMPLYMYTAEPIVEGEVKAELVLNGENLGPYMGSFDWRAVYLGTFSTGERVEVFLYPTAEYFLQYGTYFAYEDCAALEYACSEIKSRAEDAQLEKLSSSRLHWSGSADESGLLLFTVPDDKGWKATVDGEAAEIIRVFDTLIALELAPGEHIVELRFTPPGFVAGASVSLLAALIFVLLQKKKLL